MNGILDHVVKQASDEVPSPDGPFGSLRHATMNLRKEGYTKGEVEELVFDLKERGEILYFAGLLIPTEDEILQRTLAWELSREHPRRLLIKKLRRALDGP